MMLLDILPTSSHLSPPPKGRRRFTKDGARLTCIICRKEESAFPIQSENSEVKRTDDPNTTRGETLAGGTTCKHSVMVLEG